MPKQIGGQVYLKAWIYEVKTDKNWCQEYKVLVSSAIQKQMTMKRLARRFVIKFVFWRDSDIQTIRIISNHWTHIWQSLTIFDIYWRHFGVCCRNQDPDMRLTGSAAHLALHVFQVTGVSLLLGRNIVNHFITFDNPSKSPKLRVEMRRTMDLQCADHD